MLVRRFQLAFLLSLAVPVIVTSGLGASVVHADEVDPVVLARDQFRDGVALMTAGDFAGALAKFKLVARVKMNAQVAFNIADCEEHLGKLVSALGNYRLAAQKAQDGTASQVAGVVDARIDALDKRIPRLTIERVEPSPNPRAAIQLDGTEVASSLIGKSMQVDPGDRLVSVVADGRVLGTEHVTLTEGASKTLKVKIPAIVELPSGPSGGGGGPSVPGIVLSATGGASLLVGFIAIGVRQSAIGDLDKVCSAQHVCPSSAKPTADRGKLMTGLAEVTIPVGVVALTTGIVLLATHKKTTAPATAMLGPVNVGFGAPGADGPGASLTGRF